MSTPDDSQTHANEPGSTEEEIRSTQSDMVERVMPVILVEMISRRLFDPTRLDDGEYVWSVVHENLKEVVTPDMRMGVLIHGQFVDEARAAVQEERPLVAVVLIATAVEHVLNGFYREILRGKGLTDDQITQAIRNNQTTDKVGWLLQLACGVQLSPDIRGRVCFLMDLRNAIVHYKHVPRMLDLGGGSLDRIQESLARLDLETEVELPRELGEALGRILTDVDPRWQQAAIAFAAMTGAQEAIPWTLF